MTASRILLGIDTGGTYTDAVLFTREEGVIASAKSLTTRHDLSEGIRGAAEKVLADTGTDPFDVRLVSLSTTLATNALVEGQGGRVCLVMIGFSPSDLERDGLKRSLGTDPLILLPGGHNAHGEEAPLDVSELGKRLEELASSVSAFAVAGYFAVRNPAHELQVRNLISAKTALPVTCSHELSSKLGGPRRALTTLLNARLISLIDRLIGSSETYMSQRGINAPMMVVRGDGALISADQAKFRPIETILSGPAASLVGAQFLTGLQDAVVSDIGGTTTDIAVLDKGHPRLDNEGALVGGHRTMVNAIAMHTYGLGGDSEVRIDSRSLEAKLRLGPRRVLPLSLLAKLHGDVVHATLRRQAQAELHGPHFGRFALRSGLPDKYATGLSNSESALYARVPNTPGPLADVIESALQLPTLDRLVARGLVHISAITPSDAMHVLDRQGQWDREAALLGLNIACKLRSGSGNAIAGSAAQLAQMIETQMTRQSAEAILESVLLEEGEGRINPATSLEVDRALKKTSGVARFSLALDRPLVGLGASAHVYYPAVAEMLHSESVVPQHADVANAVGAVAGEISETVQVTVVTIDEGVFTVSGGGPTEQMAGESETLSLARSRAEKAARALAINSGAEDPAVVLTESVDAAEIGGSRKLLEARFVATASGRPRMA